mmetsp:Transcript_62323/g.193364  ORF Transcript_62323/g.193364 Transcript_62323/m.193364 type:complete len:271 (+) Transcript_62323:1487-2299(+)
MLAPPPLHGPLHRMHNKDGRHGQENEEQGQGDASLLRPDTVADELEDVDRVGVVFEEVQARKHRGHAATRKARQTGQAEEDRSLEWQQHREPRGELVAPRLQRRQGEDQEQTKISRRCHKLHGQSPAQRHACRHRFAVQQKPQLREKHAQHEDMQVARRVELEEDHAQVEPRVRRAPGVLLVPHDALVCERRDEDHEPREEEQARHQSHGDTKRDAPQAAGERLEKEPIDHHGRKEPTMHLQRVLCPRRHPGLQEPRLRHQDDGLGRDVQ